MRKNVLFTFLHTTQIEWGKMFCLLFFTPLRLNEKKCFVYFSSHHPDWMRKTVLSTFLRTTQIEWGKMFCLLFFTPPRLNEEKSFVYISSHHPDWMGKIFILNKKMLKKNLGWKDKNQGKTVCICSNRHWWRSTGTGGAALALVAQYRYWWRSV